MDDAAEYEGEDEDRNEIPQSSIDDEDGLLIEDDDHDGSDSENEQESVEDEEDFIETEQPRREKKIPDRERINVNNNLYLLKILMCYITNCNSKFQSIYLPILHL